MRHAALLRGVNVGGKNKLPMKDLAEIFVKAGCRDVATYIQSGNVVFSAPAAVLKKLPGMISQSIAKEFGHRVPVVIRSHEELAAVVQGNPFLKGATADKAHFVVFLADMPAADAVAKLDPQRSPPDRYIVVGKEIYLHLLNGAAKTRLTNAWMDSKLSTISTARNWATVLKLHEMTKDQGPAR
jgi:uncharacterized protein (DUF1697 family)